MATQLPCKKNDSGGYTFYISLVSQANTKIMQANPTLAAGDFKIMIDDGAPANLGTLPAVDADSTKRVKVVLSQAETNGDNLTIIGSDAAGAEWCDITVNIQTAARQLDDHAFPLTTGRGLLVDTDGSVMSNKLRYATAQTTTGVSTEIKLDGSASASNDFYNNTYIHILSGTAAGESRMIQDYVGATKVATVDRAWIANPTNDSVFIILPFGGVAGATAPTADENAAATWDKARASHTTPGSFGEYVLADAILVSGDATTANNLQAIFAVLDSPAILGYIDSGTAQSVDATHIQFRSAFLATDDVMIGATVHIYDSTAGKYQSRVILDWVSSTDTATVDAWNETPTGPVKYVCFSTAPASASSPIPVKVTHWGTSAIATVDTGGYPVVTIKDGIGQGELLTTSGVADVNTVQVSGDTTAADNQEAFFDGTGYAGTNNVIPSVTTVTGNVNGSVGSVTGAVGSVTGAVGSVTGAVGSVTALAANSMTAAALAADAVAEISGAILTTALTESYAADGAAPTLAQAIFGIQQYLQEHGISGTVLTVNKLDGTTPAMTFNLDSATTPTSITRAT